MASYCFVNQVSDDEIIVSDCDLQDLSVTPLLNALHSHKTFAVLDLSHNFLGISCWIVALIYSSHLHFMQKCNTSFPQKAKTYNECNWAVYVLLLLELLHRRKWDDGETSEGVH